MASLSLRGDIQLAVNVRIKLSLEKIVSLVSLIVNAVGLLFR